MKYMNLGHVLFGCLLLALGLLLIVNTLFGFELPLGRTIGGLILLYIGLCIIFTGSWGYCTGHRTSHRSRSGAHYIRKETAHIRVTDDKIHGSRPTLCFDTRAGQTTIDLTPLTELALSRLEKPLEIQSRTRVGQTIFIINKNIPVEIHARTGWGDTQLPDGSHKTMGSSHYRSHPDSRPLIVIYTEVRMGNVEFITA